MESVYEMVGGAMITYLALWQKDMIIYYVAGIVIIILAANWVADFPGVSIAVWFFGAYLIIKGNQMALQTGGVSRGWGQLRALFKRGDKESPE